MKLTCSVCGDQGDLRPYGKDGSLICFDCMIGSPEREQEAKRQFAGRLALAGDVVLLTEAGPAPAPDPMRRLVGAPPPSRGERSPT